MGSNTSTMLNKPTLPSKYCERPHNPCPSRNMSSICLPCMYLSNTGDLKPYIKCVCKLDNKLCTMCKEYMRNKMFPPGDSLSILKPYEPLAASKYATIDYNNTRCDQCEAQRQNPNDYAMGVHSMNCPVLHRSRANMTL